MSEFLKQLYIQRILKYALYMFLALVIQNMLFTKFRPLGICPFWLPAVVVSVGMFEGPDAGVAFGMITGIFADMAFHESTVLFLLLFSALAFGAGFVSQFFINRRFFAFMGLAFMALLITSMVQMIVCLASDAWSIEMVKTAVIQTIWSLPFAAIAYLPPARWIE